MIKLLTLLKQFFEKIVKLDQMEIKLSKIIDDMKPKSGPNIFKCSNIDFETNSEYVLKIHFKTKHTKLEEETYPRTCDICENTCKNS